MKIFSKLYWSTYAVLVCAFFMGVKFEPFAVDVTPYVEQGPVDQPFDYSSKCSYKAPEDFNQLIDFAGVEFGVNPKVLALTIWRESGCNVSARGGAGEIGLMQVNPRYWTKTLADIGITEYVSAKNNIRAGAYILSHYAKTRDGIKVIEKYNGRGPLARAYAKAQADVYLSTWGYPLKVSL